MLTTATVSTGWHRTAIKTTYRSFVTEQDTETQSPSSCLGQIIQYFWIVRRRCNFEFSILAFCTTSKELMSVCGWLVWGFLGCLFWFGCFLGSGSLSVYLIYCFYFVFLFNKKLIRKEEEGKRQKDPIGSCIKAWLATMKKLKCWKFFRK